MNCARSGKSQRHEFKDCLLLPAHGKEISDAKKVIDRIVFSYLDKVEIMHTDILEHSRKDKNDPGDRNHCLRNASSSERYSRIY